MTTTIECTLDAGRVAFTATVDDENAWKINGKNAPKPIVDNLLPDFKQAGSSICMELMGKEFNSPSERYAARAVERLRYMFSSMVVVPPKKRGRKPKTHVEKLVK